MAAAPEAPCLCQSERPFGSCHLPMVLQAFRAKARRKYSFKVPDHIGKDAADRIARHLDANTAYQVGYLESHAFEFAERSPQPMLRLIPFLRAENHPGRLSITPGTFEGITFWPDIDTLSEDRIDKAEQRVLGIAANWTPEQLFAIRGAFAQMLAKPDLASLNEAIPEIVLTLRTALPEATIDVLRITSRTISDADLIRCLASMPHVTEATLIDIMSRPPLGTGPISVFHDPEPHFELLGNLCFPRVASFGIRFGSEAYVIIDYGREIRLEAREWVERRARDIGARLYSGRSNTIAVEPFPKYSPADRHFLRVWLTRRLSHLFAHLTHLEYAVTSPATTSVDTTALWKDMLTLQDIVSLTQLVATSSDPATRAPLFFDLIDRYGFIGGKPELSISELLSSTFINKLVAALDDSLGDMRPHVQKYIQESWARVVEGVWKGVLDEESRNTRTLTFTSPDKPTRQVTGDGAVSVLMRVLRNTTHGYHLDGNDFERYLIRHDGVVPDAIRELSIALWFGLLSAPQVFWGSVGRFDALEAFDRTPAEPAPPR